MVMFQYHYFLCFQRIGHHCILAPVAGVYRAPAPWDVGRPKQGEAFHPRILSRHKISVRFMLIWQTFGSAPDISLI